MKTGKRRLAAFAVVAATMLLALVGVVTPAWAEGGIYYSASAGNWQQGYDHLDAYHEQGCCGAECAV